MLLLLTSCVFELKDGTYIWSDLTIDGVLADENNGSFVEECNFYISVMDPSEDRFNLSVDKEENTIIVDNDKASFDENDLIFKDLNYNISFQECLTDVFQETSGLITSRESFVIESVLIFSESNNKCYNYLIPCNVNVSVNADLLK